MSHANINGQEISFEDSGGTGMPVLLGHGFLMDRTMFAAQVAALTPKYRVVTYDFRGFGETRFDGSSFTYWDLAKDVVGLMDHLHIDRAVVGGMSQGGYVALRVALAAPERVRALVLIDSQGGAEDPAVAAGYAQLLEAWAAHGPVDQIANTVAKIIIDHPDHNDAWIAKWRSREPGLIVEPGKCLLERDSVSERLGEVKQPTLIVHGTNDGAISVEVMKRTTALLPNTKTVLIEGGTHASNVTHPDLVNDALLAFLSDIAVR